MKTVQDKDGNIIEVSDNTPCHAGKNGALPIMYDRVVDAGIFAEIAAREAQYEAEAPERAQNAIKAGIKKLEDAISPRRMREAILGTDNNWLSNQEAKIIIARNKL